MHDLEWPWLAILRQILFSRRFGWLRPCDFRQIIAWKQIKIDAYCQRRKSLAATLVSSNIRFVHGVENARPTVMERQSYKKSKKDEAFIAEWRTYKHYYNVHSNMVLGEPFRIFVTIMLTKIRKGSPRARALKWQWGRKNSQFSANKSPYLRNGAR